MYREKSPEKSDKKIKEKEKEMMELLEGVDKVKESEKIMSTKDFQETGEKVNLFLSKLNYAFCLGNQQIQEQVCYQNKKEMIEFNILLKLSLIMDLLINIMHNFF